MLEQIREMLRVALEERAAAQTKVDEILAAPKAEARDLNDDETSAFNEALGAKKVLDEKIADLTDREATLVEDERANQAAADLAKRLGGPNPRTPAVVKNEERTYSRNAEQRGVSFLRDVANETRDPEARDRLNAHRHEMQVDGVEKRDVGTGAFGALVVPQYLTGMFAPVPRAMAPTVAICTRRPLPPDGMVFNIPRATTGTAVTEQAAEADGATEVNFDETTLAVDVRTYSGMQDVSRQALDRGTNVDSIITEDLTRAYWTKVDSHVLDGSGTTGQLLGIYNVSSVGSVTYTATTATAAELYSKLASAISTVQSGVYSSGQVSHFVMHPRRWWWLASQAGTSFPFLHTLGVSNEQAGNEGDSSYGSMARNVHGVPVVLDANIATTDGSGTDEDYILAVSANELHFWDEGGPLRIRAEEVLSSTLQVRFVLYGYVAFAAGRYPGAHCKISGTGLNDTI
jgi:HK97 family phage major capsid protein